MALNPIYSYGGVQEDSIKEMNKGCLEAFSDAVITILITIMVLELAVPQGDDLSDLLPLLPIFLIYSHRVVYLSNYWNNHHHLLQAARQVNGSVLWVNLHLLFWLSLVSFGSAWMGENPGASWPTALYGIVFFFAAVAYYILVRALIARHGQDSLLAKAIGADFIGKISIIL